MLRYNLVKLGITKVLTILVLKRLLKAMVRSIVQ